MEEFKRAILFTGHMIDAPGRAKERFPARAEEAGRRAITESLQKLVVEADGGQDFGRDGGRVVGIAGGASGGDILFHEACEALGVPSLLRLALPAEEYIAASVAAAGGEWVRRFHALVARLGAGAIGVLDDSVVLPESLTGGATLNVWQRTNLWMVEETLRLAPQRTLLALWDGEAADGPGGTEHLVKLAPSFGMDVAPIIAAQMLVASSA